MCFIFSAEMKVAPQVNLDIDTGEIIAQTKSEELELEERQMLCPPGRAGRRCRKNLGEEQLEKRQMMCPPGRAGRICRKNLGEEQLEKRKIM